jgi:hypothetical protein
MIFIVTMMMRKRRRRKRRRKELQPNLNNSPQFLGGAKGSSNIISRSPGRDLNQGLLEYKVILLG